MSYSTVYVPAVKPPKLSATTFTGANAGRRILAAAKPVVFGRVLLIKVRITSGLAHPFVSAAQSATVATPEHATGAAQAEKSPSSEDTSATPSITTQFTPLAAKPAVEPPRRLRMRKGNAQNVPLWFIRLKILFVKTVFALTSLDNAIYVN